MNNLQVRLGESNGDGRQRITYCWDGACFPDAVDMARAFEREESIKRATRHFGIGSKDVVDLSHQLAGLAAEAEQTKGGKPPPRMYSLRELAAEYPRQRDPVIHPLLRFGETANIVAVPKRGKSWLVDGLALSVTSGSDWLGTFPCTQGRVLIIDGELHEEVISYRLSIVAEKMGVSPDCQDLITVLPLRGKGYDLLTLRPLLESIEPRRYVLIILDAWYRFLPVGYSENDNAQIMALYNVLDGYTAMLGSAWANIHHTSKGDQSGKGTTDVGSGAGSQSRAADTHLIIRQHEQDDVAVVEAVVRSFPPVEPLAIRWSFPVWQRDDQADIRRLWKPQMGRERAAKENRDAHLDEDRQVIVNGMVGIPGPQTKTFVRDSIRLGNPRFCYAWASLITDGTITSIGVVKKGNNRPYEGFILSHQEPQ